MIRLLLLTLTKEHLLVPRCCEPGDYRDYWRLRVWGRGATRHAIFGYFLC